MSIQAALNADSMNSVPKISEIIAKAESFEANQMEQSTLRAMMNSPVAIVDMDNEQLEKFQTDSIEYFKHMGWLD
ncbi:MAG: hypothetical protein ACTIMZ_09480 [Pseudoalteromonas distincta]|uniref:hypothetical protein n=1 Tax=Pseudoalteromonas distincta TaxID=77608 RepID=UPI003F981997